MRVESLLEIKRGDLPIHLFLQSSIRYSYGIPFKRELGVTFAKRVHKIVIIIIF